MRSLLIRSRSIGASVASLLLSARIVPSEEERAGRCKEIMRLQATGLAERLTKIGIRKCVIGVSGGLDSTLALLVIKEAYDMLGWPLTDIIGITMPGFGTTDLTKTNSWKLMEQLGITIRMINITDACLQHFEDIGHKRDSYDVTYDHHCKCTSQELTQTYHLFLLRYRPLCLRYPSKSEYALLAGALTMVIICLCMQ